MTNKTIKEVSRTTDGRRICNVPGHVNYQPEVDGLTNLYRPLKHQPVAGKSEHIHQLMHHIFGKQVELGYDYLQLLYLFPTQKLPCLYLASNWPATGKTTFCALLEAMFGENVVRMDEAKARSFNAGFVTKLVAIYEDCHWSGRTMENILGYASSTRALRDARGEWQQEVDVHLHFVLTGNTSSKITAASHRVWEVKVPQVLNVIPELSERITKEVPAFLHFLTQRSLSTLQASRTWFDPQDLTRKS